MDENELAAHKMLRAVPGTRQISKNAIIKKKKKKCYHLPLLQASMIRDGGWGWGGGEGCFPGERQAVAVTIEGVKEGGSWEPSPGCVISTALPSSLPSCQRSAGKWLWLSMFSGHLGVILCLLLLCSLNSHQLHKRQPKNGPKAPENRGHLIDF